MKNRLKLAQSRPKTLRIAAKRFEIRAAADNTRAADVWLYSDIGANPWGGDGIGAKQFADELGALGPIDEIRCYINSGGGDVFEGLAIYNVLKRHKAKKIVSVDGLAASIASVIAMAGDEISMSANAFMMIHDPWTMASGNAGDLREVADQLDKVGGELADTYSRRTKMAIGKVSDLMAAETWMTADEAVANGFADEKTEDQPAMAASINLKRFKHAPRVLVEASAPAPAGGSFRDRIAAEERELKRMRGAGTSNDVGDPPGSPNLPPQTSSPLVPSPEIAKPAAPEHDDTPSDPMDAGIDLIHKAALACVGQVGAQTKPGAYPHASTIRRCMDAHSACNAALGMIHNDADGAEDQVKVAGDALQAVADSLDGSKDADAMKCAEACKAASLACGKMLE